ncbi:MAG: hypothetical protein IAB08_02435 [Bacteroidetes bacterium]|uniref:ATP synthase F1 complex delta/epsilon subunit N-terminal domain-containing protein n=1 Tax=Candidatus Pullibacteroides excrementavium TaxID=2840905 RepID=A0A9D9DR68_9BACT|nr:hypothetical protein [Candidatus Pullibacteroides excrementavium]
MQFKIENPDKEVLNIEAKLIQLPGLDGSFAVLENHAPLIATLKKGQVRIIDKNDKEHLLDIDGGIFGVAENLCHLLLL